MCLRYCIRKKTKLYTRCSVHKYFRTLSFDELEITESLFTACLFCNTQPNKKLTVKSGLRPSNHKIVSFWWLLSNHDLWCIWSLTDVIILSRLLLATILWIIQTRVSWSWVVVMAAFWICCAPGTNQRWTDLALIYKIDMTMFSILKWSKSTKSWCDSVPFICGKRPVTRWTVLLVTIIEFGAKIVSPGTDWLILLTLRPLS